VSPAPAAAPTDTPSATPAAAPAAPAGGGAHPDADVHIERLALRVAGLDEDAACALARLVAEGLAPGLLRSAGIAGLDSLKVEVKAGAADKDKPDVLARRIVDAVGRVLATDRASGGPDGEVVP
jgi:hypothetical protein